MKRFLQIILSSFLVVFSLQVGAQTQIVSIAPDIETLTRPFSPDDEDSFREPDKVFGSILSAVIYQKRESMPT